MADSSTPGEPIKQVMADSVTGSVALPNSAAVAATAAPRLVSAPVPMDTTHVQLPTTPAAAAAVVGTTAAPSLVPGSIALPMAPVPMGAPHLPTAPAPPAAVMAGNTEEDDDDSEDDDDEEDEDSGSTTPEPQRKRRKIDPAQDMKTLVNFMENYKRGHGENANTPLQLFIRAPKRRQDPQYYEKVSDPIDMMKIKLKLNTEEYSGMAELKADFEKLFANAILYYAEGTEHHVAATELKALFTKAYGLVMSGEDPVTKLGDRDDSDAELTDALEDLFAAVVAATDPSDANRALHMAFRLLPSKNRYPEYYTLIKDPIDLKTIAMKIQEGEYSSLDELEDDFAKMVRNAQTFNEPGSQIYKDARAIQKIIKGKKSELEAQKAAKENRGSRVTRGRLDKNKKHYTAEIASLAYEESESEESSEEEYDKEDPLWALYQHVRNYKSPKDDLLLCDPFLQLPSRREFADYYLTIGEPISLNEIRKKLKASEYESLASLYEDMDLMFENCKEYNRPDSGLYKDGVKLQRIAKAKFEELGGSNDGDSSEDSDSDDDSDEDDEDAALKTPGRPPLTALAKVLRAMYNSIYKYRNKDGVQLIGMFIEKPSKKDYPDYYKVITQPMDMETIDEKIKKNQYTTSDEALADFKLMFNNCRRYNEEGSDIWNDANTLERVLMTKVKELAIEHPGLVSLKKTISTIGMMAAPGAPVAPIKKAPLSGKALQAKCKQLLDKIRDYKDPKGRQLSLIFLRLPNPKDFPDYYEVIKKPIDFERISAKVKQGVYRSMEECLNDFVLMFDNASKYNEPDSQIYKDALSLQSMAKMEFRTLVQDEQDDGKVPDVMAAFQDILTGIFVSLYTHSDAEERCYSDSLAELPEHDMISDGAGGVKKARALNLDLIKRRLDRGLYKSLDIFQRDIFLVLERARNLSRSDSQVFEDAVELQRHFIQTRDEYCEHGERLQSRALLYTQANLKSSVDALKSKKQQDELPEEDEDDKTGVVSSSGSSTMFGQEAYHVGEFVYTESDAATTGTAKKIFLIEKIYADPASGAQMMSGSRFFRPVETFHVPSRKFLEREVFRTDVKENFGFDKVVGRCYVMPARDYFRSAPVGFKDEDVYVCESQYSSKQKSFKKKKNFWNIPDHIKVIPRAKPLEPNRVMSIFKERIEKHKEELDELAALEKTVDVPIPPHVIWDNTENITLGGEGATYYEQYTIPGPITLRRGDAVYVRAENGKNLIAQIDSMWTAPNDKMAYFHGPWFVTPSETPHHPTQLFYKQEAFISTIQDSNPLLSVVGKCCVLEVDDYRSSRPVNHEEVDVYICESVYDESRRMTRPLPTTGLKHYEHVSSDVVPEEVFFFKRKIVVNKDANSNGTVMVGANAGAMLVQPNAVPAPPVGAIPVNPVMTMPAGVNPTPSAVGGTVISMETENEDSMDAPSVGSTETVGPTVVHAAPTPPTPTTSTPSGNKKVEKIRKKTVTPYILWASVMRKQIAQDNKDKGFGEVSRIVGEMWRTMSDSEKSVWEEKCKKMNREVAARMAAEASGEKNDRTAFQNHRDQILNPDRTPTKPTTTVASVATATLPLQPTNVSNVPTSVAQLQFPTQPVSPNPAQMVAQLPPGAPAAAAAKPIEPIFHTVPPRPQRLLHSEAYIRYIEGLTTESQSMCNWDKQLNATKENTRTDEARLPAHWLAENGEHGTSLDALWALRDFLVQDSLNVVKISYNNY